MRWGALFLVLVVAQALCRPQPARTTDPAALSAQFPGALQSVVYGAFQPALVQWLWYEYGAARAEGRVLDAVRTLRVLARVEPANPRAILYLAHVLAHDLADRESSPAGRADRIGDGLRVLEDAERRGPLADDPHLPGARGLLLRSVMDEEIAVVRAVSRRLGQRPLAAAYAAFRRTQELAPGSVNVRLSVVEAGRDRALELFLVESDRPGAVALLGDALGSVDPVARHTAPLVVTLAASWRRILASLDPDRTSDLPDALDALRETLEQLPAEGGTEGPDAESAWVAAALPQLLGAAEASRRGRPELSLSVVEALRRIQAVSARRWALSSVAMAPGASYIQRWEALLVALEKDLPDRAAALSVLKPPW